MWMLWFHYRMDITKQPDTGQMPSEGFIHEWVNTQAQEGKDVSSHVSPRSSSAPALASHCSLFHSLETRGKVEQDAESEWDTKELILQGPVLQEEGLRTEALCPHLTDDPLSTKSGTNQFPWTILLGAESTKQGTLTFFIRQEWESKNPPSYSSMYYHIPKYP